MESAVSVVRISPISYIDVSSVHAGDILNGYDKVPLGTSGGEGNTLEIQCHMSIFNEPERTYCFGYKYCSVSY